MISLAYQIIRTARPRQWLKNFSIFAAPVFLGTLFVENNLHKCIIAFFIFSFAASGIYFVNDIIDAPKDRKHPIKKNRPIASGKVSEALAWVIAFVLILGSIFLAVRLVGTFFTYTIVAYILLQISYSLYLRNVIILDSLTVATGFVLRVFAGGFASSTSLSSWLILATIGLSLLLAFGKRRSEKTILAKYSKLDPDSSETRETLRHYPDTLLDSMISMSASFCIISYSLFAFQASPQNASKILTSFLPSIIKNPKWMMLTIPIVIYGVGRYLYIIYEKGEGESPERVILSDMPLLISVIAWGAAILAVIYLLPVLG
ncbi:MAG TPA: decaprenyl-phosphate phosphoribosyltransferase [Candidatus Saccharimonadales bacterium]|nr:decaprenyl-phosphate phosphoribosyltransferase [Candidatus Saccharimonadales bacterium]